MKAKEAQEKRYPHLGCESKKDSRRPSKRIERTSFFSSTIFRPASGKGGGPRFGLEGLFQGPGGLLVLSTNAKEAKEGREAQEDQGST